MVIHRRPPRCSTIFSQNCLYFGDFRECDKLLLQELPKTVSTPIFPGLQPFYFFRGFSSEPHSETIDSVSHKILGAEIIPLIGRHEISLSLYPSPMPAAKPWFSVREEINTPTAISAAPRTKKAKTEP